MIRGAASDIFGGGGGKNENSRHLLVSTLHCSFFLSPLLTLSYHTHCLSFLSWFSFPRYNTFSSDLKLLCQLSYLVPVENEWEMWSSAFCAILQAGPPCVPSSFRLTDDGNKVFVESIFFFFFSNKPWVSQVIQGIFFLSLENRCYCWALKECGKHRFH